ncbi:MAG: TatD family hydrolase [Bacteroidetes bacterium]|nr:TatD family hydrolase [Bacteroidota bacterium]
MEFCDTHCHLDLLKGIELDAASMISPNVQYIAVTNAPYLYEPNRALFSKFTNVSVALGMHPQLVDQFGGQLDKFASLLSQTGWVGEIGLDGSPQSVGSLPRQREVFDQILAMIAKGRSKILSVHTRGAEREAIQTLHNHLADTDSRVVLHWYSGPASVAASAIEHGYFFSVNHRMLNSARGKRILEVVPIDRILTETDAPFTFDQSVFSQRTSLATTVSQLATLYGIELETMVTKIRSNLDHLMIHSTGESSTLRSPVQPSQ